MAKIKRTPASSTQRARQKSTKKSATKTATEPSTSTLDTELEAGETAIKTHSPSSKASEVNKENADDSAYDEDEDDDYDPSKKADQQDESEEISDDEAQPDYSAINTEVSQVRTRGQKVKESAVLKSAHSHGRGLVEDYSRVNVDEIFQSLQAQAADDWAKMVSTEPEKETKDETRDDTSVEEKVRIFRTYTFAGKLVREEKMVDANSAEAKAYLNSVNGLPSQEDSGPRKSYVTVTRKIPGTDEERPLRIKLKRPSLIDKFLLGDKKNKLTTLEKSRLDWASFVDKKKLKDDLAIHNKGGYLEKQAFLGRIEAKRDTQYQQARELERQRQWQQQQQQRS